MNWPPPPTTTATTTTATASAITPTFPTIEQWTNMKLFHPPLFIQCTNMTCPSVSPLADTMQDTNNAHNLSSLDKNGEQNVKLSSSDLQQWCSSAK